MLDIHFHFDAEDGADLAGYNAREFFEGDAVERALAADRAEAEAILAAAYKGRDPEGVGVEWDIPPAA